MSGGIDSSVVASCLSQMGYRVIGITLQLYDASNVSKSKTCCAGRDIYDAKRIAEQFGFPHYVFNYQDVFERDVISKFASSYAEGKTPIPCVLCNQTVKFRDLLKAAYDIGADALATGHYVQRVEINGEPQMHRAVDLSKDQSYFLFTTTNSQLDFLRFPLGGLTKSETREMARKLNLEIADKPESQDICFVNSKSYTDIVSKYSKQTKGRILNMEGEVIGSHNGIAGYTLGQRKGIDVSSPEPMYVASINSLDNTITVGSKSQVMIDKLRVGAINWICDHFPANAMVRTRSSECPVGASFIKDGDDNLTVVFDEPHRIVSPGQACVLYQGNRVLGGGWVV